VIGVIYSPHLVAALRRATAGASTYTVRP
jgi:hypothetical protein